MASHTTLAQASINIVDDEPSLGVRVGRDNDDVVQHDPSHGLVTDPRSSSSQPAAASEVLPTHDVAESGRVSDLTDGADCLSSYVDLTAIDSALDSEDSDSGPPTDSFREFERQYCCYYCFGANYDRLHDARFPDERIAHGLYEDPHFDAPVEPGSRRWLAVRPRYESRRREVEHYRGDAIRGNTRDNTWADGPQLRASERRARRPRRAGHERRHMQHS